MYGLHEALVILEEEGLENAWARHRAMHEKLKAGLEAMGLRYVVEESARLPQLNSIYVPEGIDEAAAAPACWPNSIWKSAPASATCRARSGASA